MNTTPDTDHSDHWQEFADRRRPQLLAAPNLFGAYFSLGDPPAWTLRVEFVFADLARALPALESAPKDKQYVVRIYTAGPRKGTGLLWWEDVGTSLADAQDGGREPPAEAVGMGVDLEHAHTAEVLHAVDTPATIARITETLRRGGLLPPDPGIPSHDIEL